jgi:predicted AlkP superfamily pyrophosphatase or phosphodiesterase
MRRIVLVLTFLAFSACAARSLGVAPQQPAPLILISIDGWRWDYDAKAPAPNLRALMQRGVRAQNLIPSFPTKTFPNHYTIVTGLYPAHHGMVANTVAFLRTHVSTRCCSGSICPPSIAPP